MCNCPDHALLVQKVAPAIISLNVVSQEAQDDDPELQRWFKWYRGRQLERGLGSGFIIREDGYLLTNSHLLEQAVRIMVRLPDERELLASVVGLDRRSDLALLKVEAKGLPTVFLGDSDRLQVGQGVIAIGNPMGLSSTVTAGIVSALEREQLGQESEASYIQIDAPINPGNSGGPLINLRGEVVGINTAMVRGRSDLSAQAQGIGFAIPINQVKRLLPQLLTFGRVRRGYLGLRAGEVDLPLARSLGLNQPHGALVREVLDNSPASRAGLEAGDVILSFDGKPIRRPSMLSRWASAAGAAKRVQLGVWRFGKSLNLNLILGADPEDREERPANPVEHLPRSTAVAVGLGVVDVPTELATRLGLAVGQGVLVVSVEPDGLAAAAGVRLDDILLRSGRIDIRGVAAFRQLLAALTRGEVLNLLVLREQRRIFVSIQEQ